MRLQILSDTHLEFHRDGGEAFFRGLDPSDVDVLVLAGDICAGKDLVPVLSRFCAIYPRVIHVPGNHEYYGSTLRDVSRALAVAESLNTNLTTAEEPRHLEIDGVRFVLATLWFAPSDAPKECLSDFRAIRGDFEGWVYNAHLAAVRTILRHANAMSVVVTHHLPTYQSISPRFARSAINPFFATALDEVIATTRPRLWVHGHTHNALDYVHGVTRIVCNPFGYLGHETMSPIARKVVVDVDL
jgi:predicted phosphodiesterase